MIRRVVLGPAGLVQSAPSEAHEAGVASGGEAPNVCAQACPSRAILELVADKWALLVLYSLREGVMRNGELMRLIGGVSQKMLTQTLRELERNGLVQRIDHHEVPPRVEYSLSALGHSLSERVHGLGEWAQSNMSDVLAARRAFEERERSGPGPRGVGSHGA
ncbi:MAG: winged helix-turn-helix transcriptional regulator [Hyphomicrobiaceae bacterium]